MKADFPFNLQTQATYKVRFGYKTRLLLLSSSYVGFQFTFGIDDDGLVIDDVELPKWASTPEEFVMLHRAVSIRHSSLEMQR